MISAVPTGLALHITDPYSFGAIPYSNAVGFGRTPYDTRGGATFVFVWRYTIFRDGKS